MTRVKAASQARARASSRRWTDRPLARMAEMIRCSGLSFASCSALRPKARMAFVKGCVTWCIMLRKVRSLPVVGRLASRRLRIGRKVSSSLSTIPKHGSLRIRDPRVTLRVKGRANNRWKDGKLARSLQAITAGEARKRLEAQQPLGAASIVVKDSEQAAALQNLAKVHEVKDKVAIISQRDLGDGATTRDVTCIKGDRREVREWKAVPLTSAGSSETPTVRLKSSFQPPARDLQTVRIIAARVC